MLTLAGNIYTNRNRDGVSNKFFFFLYPRRAEDKGLAQDDEGRLFTARDRVKQEAIFGCCTIPSAVTVR